MSESKTNIELKKLLAENKTKEVIDELLKITANLSTLSFYNELIIISSNYNEYQKKQRLGSTFVQEQQVSYSQIKIALIQIIDSLPDKQNGVQTIKKSNFSKRYLILIVGIILSLVVTTLYISNKDHIEPTENVIRIDSTRNDPIVGNDSIDLPTNKHHPVEYRSEQKIKKEGSPKIKIEQITRNTIDSPLVEVDSPIVANISPKDTQEFKKDRNLKLRLENTGAIRIIASQYDWKETIKEHTERNFELDVHKGKIIVKRFDPNGKQLEPGFQKIISQKEEIYILMNKKWELKKYKKNG